ncbi:ATP-binding cassette domain-containing protein [Paenibacillus sp. LMG 31456]|uniref:ATP-binding cassette domain-containing protein n=1 Tax=Paenibacillus foliorum TaxID=2654974 RepID=A0A972H1J2_9BACL|nr:ABC transporter ATP-binding protein [Paenibacillus foliorum]NOU96885.1 ATP-binding cassette domain-containing protein [Paenibacillus foliorum]
MNQPVLQVKGVKTHFFTENGAVPSVDGITFNLFKGEILGIVGESGSGKSVTSLSVMRLIEHPGKIVEGEIRYQDRDLLQLEESEMRRIRGREIGMIFQEPLTALNPVFRIGHQIQESLMNHYKLNKQEAKQRVLELLRRVNIARPESVYEAFPHELSGGMRQRAMIAMAISCNPKILIADEPTTALDVTIQAQILRIMKEIIEKEGSSVILITHDLGVIAEMADRVAVMYAGQIVEQCDVFTLFREPKHPYTKGLLKSTPKLHNLKETLDSIEGSVPNPLFMPSGCRFHPRCPYATESCTKHEPELIEPAPDHQVRCLMYGQEFEQHWQRRGEADGNDGKPQSDFTNSEIKQAF